jgi:membrane associated rhomboid family serine protease
VLPLSDAGRYRGTFPYVNVVLLALNTLVFLYEISLGGFGFLFGGSNLNIAAFFLTYGFIPAELSTGLAFEIAPLERGGGINIATPIPTWGTLLSCMFIHGGLMHFIGNMLFLWVFGDNIEDTFGHIKYLVFYLAAGVLATLAHFAIDPISQTPLVGASGAISGVMGAYLLLYPRNRIRTLIIYFLITVVELRAVWLLLVWFGLQTIQGLLSIGVSDQVSTAFFAHIGGFVVGAAIGLLVRPFRRNRGGGAGYRTGGYGRERPAQYWRGRRID